MVIVADLADLVELRIGNIRRAYPNLSGASAVVLQCRQPRCHMRLIGVAACCTVLAASAATLGARGAAEMSATEKQRLSEATTVLQTRADTPEHEIPQDTAHRAACVIVIPSVKKAAFIVGGEYGKGMLTCRNADGWSAPAFVQIEKGSIGFQAGGEEIDLVLLVMNRRGVDKLLRDKVSLGAGMSVAAGPAGGTASASTDGKFRAEILSYSRSRGAFIGADLSGGMLGPDADANRDVYGASVIAADIINGHATTPREANAFLAAVQVEFGGTTATASQ
jgi:lipid-binding SYLF domain-containing protein